MRGVKSILVGLDLGPRGRTVAPGSQRAAAQALWLASLLEARVVLLHSTAWDESWEPSEGNYVVAPGGMRPEGRAALEEVAARFRERGVPVEGVVTEETGWLAIVRHVMREGIDLVVTGKRSDVERREPRLGTVARKLLRKCPCAVWVVEPGTRGRPQRILDATDLGPVGARAVATAAGLASLAEADLHVVHAFQLPLSVQLERGDGEAEYAEKARAEAVAAIERQLAALGFRGASVHVALTAPTRLIVECADRHAADVVVLGSVSRGGIAGLIIGNTAERLLDRLACDLLAVKPEDFVCPVEP